jgi:hypothetical protein
MELEYIKNKIKKELLKKKFKNWDKDTIIFLIYVFNNLKYSEFYEVNLLLLDDYIKWYQKNNTLNDMYTIDKLIKLYCLIKEDLYYEKTNDYIYFLNDDFDKEEVIKKELYKEELSLNDFYLYFINQKFCSLSIALMISIIYIFLKYIYILFFNKINLIDKIEEKKKYELKIPIPEDIMSNPLVKYFLENNKLFDTKLFFN